METLRGIKHFRSDPEWLSKMLVMSVLLLIPMVGPIVVLGWSALFLRGIVRGRPREWTPPLRFDFDYLLKLADSGFRVWIVQVAWTFPIVFIVMFLFGGAAVATGVIAWAAGPAHHAGGGPGIIPFIMPILYLVMLPVLLAAQIPAMYAATRVELTNELKDGFAFGEVMKMAKTMFKETMIGLLVVTIVSIPIALLGELACFVGLFVSIWVIYFIRTHFQGQLYQRYLEKGGTPLQIAPDEIAMPTPVAAPAT